MGRDNLAERGTVALLQHGHSAALLSALQHATLREHGLGVSVSEAAAWLTVGAESPQLHRRLVVVSVTDESGQGLLSRQGTAVGTRPFVISQQLADLRTVVLVARHVLERLELPHELSQRLVAPGLQFRLVLIVAVPLDRATHVGRYQQGLDSHLLRPLVLRCTSQVRLQVGAGRDERCLRLPATVEEGHLTLQRRQHDRLVEGLPSADVQQLRIVHGHALVYCLVHILLGIIVVAGVESLS